MTEYRYLVVHLPHPWDRNMAADITRGCITRKYSVTEESMMRLQHIFDTHHSDVFVDLRNKSVGLAKAKGQ